MSFTPQPERKLRAEEEKKTSGLKAACILTGTVILLAGAGVHFTGGKTFLSSMTGESASSSEIISMGNQATQVRLISPDSAAEALSHSEFSPDEQSQILAAVKRRELRLVEMPVFDAAGSGGIVTISCGTMSQTVHLAPTPKTLILPITVAGTVSVTPASDPGMSGIGTGVITMFGPQALPVIHGGQTLSMTVIAQ
ncbi:hypothetical protein [Acetobacter thailandicus]|uniref:hypothetical protein n=1 Tax=Acetobacter thailandicus TaxID=1502842 RepID=UPI001BABFBC1|nr:hypothetical protein [Acetobacter thailandicus]MBS0985882.1 hypothetical protein [Acetobacter thailandicus]